MKNRWVSHRKVMAGSVAAALLLAGWALLPTNEADEEMSALQAPAQRAVQTAQLPVATPSGAEPATAPATAQPPLSAKERARSDKAALAERAAVQRDEQGDSGSAIAALVGARPDAEELPEIASRTERAMSAGEKAAQTDRVVLRLNERVARLREQLQQARDAGDDATLSRRQIMLARLDRRVQSLQERSRAWHELGTQQDSAPGHLDEHGHSAAHDGSGHGHNEEHDHSDSGHSDSGHHGMEHDDEDGLGQ